MIDTQFLRIQFGIQVVEDWGLGASNTADALLLGYGMGFGVQNFTFISRLRIPGHSLWFRFWQSGLEFRVSYKPLSTRLFAICPGQTRYPLERRSIQCWYRLQG